MRYLIILIITTICNLSYAQIQGSWGTNGTDLHNGEGYTSPIIRYSDSMNLYYILSADSIYPSYYRMDTVSVNGGTWGLLDSTIIAQDFVIMDNGDLVFVRFQNGTMEIEGTDPLGQSLWTSSPAGQTYSGVGFHQAKLFKGLSDEVFISALNDGNGDTYKYANQNWEVIGPYSGKLEFLSNGEPVRASMDYDMTPGSQWITYTFENFNGSNWVLLDSAHFTQEAVSGFDFCVNKYDSIYIARSVPFITEVVKVFAVDNFVSTQVGPSLSSGDALAGLRITSDLLGDLHVFYSSYSLGWEYLRHLALDASTFTSFGSGSLFVGQPGFPNQSATNSPISTCIDETNCVGFAIAEHTDHFQLNGPDTIFVNTQKFCSCKYTDLQNTITEQSNTLYANTSTLENASYQWLDCGNNFAVITGATDDEYTPLANGSYALEVSVGGCVDTSDCVDISTIGLVDLNENFTIRYYPNPVKQTLKIELNNLIPASIQIVDLSGKVLRTEAINEKEAIVDVSDLSAGTYLVRLESNSFVNVQYILKQ